MKTRLSLSRSTVLRLFFLVPLLLAVACDFLIPALARNGFAATWWHTLLTRTLCTVSVGALMLFCDISPLRPTARLSLRRPWIAVAVTVGAFLVALNNLPALALLTGGARVTSALPDLFLFAFGCLAIGFFEECLFRGFFLSFLLKKMQKNRRGRFLAVLISSAAFGLIHLFNLAYGGGVGATFLQVGYSFLIGGLLAALVLATGRLLPAALCHALYDFCGRLVPVCGEGKLWDTPTVVITVVLSVAVAAVTLLVLFDEGREEVAA